MKKDIGVLVAVLGVLLINLLISETMANGPDNPLFENVFVYTGHVGVIVEGNGGSSGNIEFSLPEPSTVLKALLYTNIEDGSGLASATINGVDLGEVSAYSTDMLIGRTENGFRWDASSVVTGGGDYSVSVGPGKTYFHELVVVFASPLVPMRQIIINDGNEWLVRRNGPVSQTTTFHDVHESDDAEVIFSVGGGDPSDTWTSGPEEKAVFNGIILESWDPWNADHGDELDIDVYLVSTIAGENTATVGSEYDMIGWHLVVLCVNIQTPVGGVWIPVNKLELLAPWIGLVSLITAAIASVVYVKHRKKQQN